MICIYSVTRKMQDYSKKKQVAKQLVYRKYGALLFEQTTAETVILTTFRYFPSLLAKLSIITAS